MNNRNPATTPRHLARSLRQLARTVFDTLLLRYIRGIEIAILLVGLLGGVYLIATIWLYRSDQDISSSAPQQAILATETIDQLELWIEQRQQQLQTPLNLGPREYFEQDLNQ